MFRLFPLGLCMLLLTGCTTIGSYLVSHPELYLSEARFIKAKPHTLGFTKHQFCSATELRCVTYLAALPYQAEDFPADGAVYYNLHARGNGVENVISHRMTPDTFHRLTGTALLVHGYGGNKEVMMASAIYFRALGMQVIMPDLYGHGDSQQPFAFGAREHGLLAELLASQATGQHRGPTLVVGHSMGGLVAARLLASEHVDAAILLAPMMRFDLAARQYLPGKAPLLSRLFGGQLDDIVARAMADAAVPLADTDLLRPLQQSSKPLLLIHSDVDEVSPPDYFEGLLNERVTQLIFKQRTHSSLMLFDNEDVDKIERWLLAL